MHPLRLGPFAVVIFFPEPTRVGLVLTTGGCAHPPKTLTLYPTGLAGDGPEGFDSPLNEGKS